MAWAGAVGKRLWGLRIPMHTSVNEGAVIGGVLEVSEVLGAWNLGGHPISRA